MGKEPFPAHALDRRDGVSCPQSNNTIYTANGYSWAILCNNDFPGNDLPSQSASNLSECIDACNSYKQNEKYLNGAACVAVVFGAASNNGNQCFLKSQITNVTYGNFEEYVARRTTYNIGDAPVYTSILPSAAATSSSSPSSAQAAQATSTSNPSSQSQPATLSSSSSGLSEGAKIGIGVGVGVGAALIISLILALLFTRRRRSRNSHTQPFPLTTGATAGPAAGSNEDSLANPNPEKASTFSHVHGAHPSNRTSGKTLQTMKPGMAEMASPHASAPYSQGKALQATEPMVAEMPAADPAASELGSRQMYELPGGEARA